MTNNDELQASEQVSKEVANIGKDTSLANNSYGNNGQVQTMWNNSAMLEKAWKSAGFLSRTALVPEMYQGKAENCLIALDIANRTGMSPLAVMQNLYVVKGKPSWSGQMCIALVNGCGRFTHDLRFNFVGEKGTNDYGCYASTHRKDDNEQVVSDTITMQMAKDEDWLNKNGSKWKTMPTQMMMYRAGAFFARVHCPDVLIGLPLADEVKDTFGYEATEKPKVVITMEDVD